MQEDCKDAGRGNPQVKESSTHDGQPGWIEWTVHKVAEYPPLRTVAFSGGVVAT